jgi:Subtilase family/Domain of unknown function (DUF4114)/Bacterial pre-peptidase C-terminal domain/LGFP repeat
MAELNIGALTDSKSYTGSVGTTNIFDLYKFNITSPGSFKFAIDDLSGNADIFLLNNSGTTLYSSTNAGTGAETISADSLVAGEYSIKVLPITGDIKYTLNLAPTNTQKSSDADTLTGAKSDPLSASSSSTTAEKATANKDVITGTPVGDKTVTAEVKATTADKQVSADSQTSLKSEPEKTVVATESAIDTSTTSDKPVITDSETAIKSETEKTTTATETVATKEPKTGETVAAVPDSSKPAEKPSPATTNGEDKKTENPNTSIPTAETTKELDSSTKKEIVAANSFTSGTFVVDSTGKVGIDYLLDGGLYRGQLAIISLKGMEKFVPGSKEFIKEAAARAMSNSEKGHIVIDDLSEGARFSGNLPEGNFNEGAYLGVKTFAMTPGDEFGIMIVPNDTFKFLSDYPNFGGDKRPLFSMVTANPNEAFHLGQIADINGEGNTFAMEDMRFDAGSDKDYNDITFQVRGAKGKAPLMDSLVNPDKDWRQTDLGKAVIAYATPYITPEPETKPNLEGEVSDIIDDLENEILNPSTSEKETPRDTESAADTEKDTQDSGIDEIISMPPSKTEEKAKDSASNSGESPQVETKDQVEANPTTVPTADKDAAVDSTEKSPVEKTLVSTEVTEVKDKVTEAPATTNVSDKSTIETEVAATITEKVEVKPEVLPAESKVKEESKPTLVMEVEKTETPQVVVTENPVESVKESQPTVAVEPKETAEVKPSLPVKQTDLDTMPVTTTNKGEESQTKEIISESPAVSDVVIPKDSLPTLPIADESIENDSTTAENPPPSIDLVPTGSEIDYSLPASLIARLESMKQSLTNLESADDPSGNSSNETLIARLESVVQKLMTVNESTPVSDRTVTLVDRLEETVDRLIIPPIQPPLPSIETAQFDFPATNQPIIGVIDTGFAGNNPDIDYSRITWGQDKVDGDADPRIEPGKGNEHGTHVLGIIAATQNNGVGIDGVNEKAPIWAGRAIGSGKWAESLVEFVNTAIESNQPNAVVNLSLDLTQVNPDGSVTTRYEFTPEERSAIEYARQHNVLLVVAAGNDGGVMSVLGQASQEFDNIITVGAAQRVNDEIALSKAYDRSDYSSYGRGLDIVAPGGTVGNPELSTVGDGVGTMAGTSVATAKVTGAISQVWAANPSLSYRQVIQIIKDTATDLKTPNWDDETGVGLLNMVAAVAWAEATRGEVYNPTPWVTPGTWSGEGKVTPEERAAKGGNSIAAATVQVSTNFSDSDRVDASQPDKYYQFTVNEPGYLKWNLTSLNPVSGFPTPPQVTIIKADGSSAYHRFTKGASIKISTVTEGQTSFSGADFYDPGTYYLKVGGGASASFQDYNISTQLIPDRVSSFAGNIQYRTQPDLSLDSKLQSGIFSGPAVSELKNLSSVLTYGANVSNSQIYRYGFEVNESGKFKINLNSPNGSLEASIRKFVGSDDTPLTISSIKATANADGILELDLNKGRYEIILQPPSNYWAEPDWNMTQQKVVRPYTLNATFTSNAPQPGQGKVPASAGTFDKTVVSNGVVTHYYKNGYLTVQPSGQASWYGYPLGVVSVSAQVINEPVPLTDPDGNYSIQTAKELLLKSGGADLGDGINRDQLMSGSILSSIGGNDLSDFYKFSLDSLKLVNFQVSDIDNGANFELIQDLNGNGQVDRGEVILTKRTNNFQSSFNRILKSGNYYLRVIPASDAITQYVVDVRAQSPENQVIRDNNSDYYLVQNGQRRLIPNRETLKALKINSQTVNRFLNEDLALIPLGNDLPSQKDGDVFSDLSGRIYLMQSGKRHLVPDWNTLRDMGINVTGMSRFPESDLKDIELGDPIYQKAIDAEYERYQGLLGNPTTDYWQVGNFPTQTKVYFRNYDNGSVYWTAKYGAIALWHEFEKTYNQNRGYRGWLGLPTKGKEDWEGGQRIKFEGGYIYWTDKEGARAFKHGELPWEKSIAAEYAGNQGLLGNPTTGYWQVAPSQIGTEGYGQNYNNGHVFWTAKYGAIALWHDFADTYNQSGGSDGWLGFPTKGKEDWQGGQRIEFEGGYIYWNAQSGAKAYPPNESPTLDKTVGYDGTNPHQTYVNTFYKNGGLSALGSPIGNVHPSGTENGYIQEFSGGSEGSGAIMKSGANDYSYWVGSNFWLEYQRAVNTERDWGYPTSDRFVDENGWPAQNFQNGKIVQQDGKLYFYIVKETSSNPDLSPTEVNKPQIINRNAESGTGKLIQGLKFRNYPWIDSSSLIQGMPVGTNFTILEKVTTTADPNLRHSDWYRVRLNDGREGYFWAGEEFIQKVAASGGSVGQIGYVGIGLTPIKEGTISYVGIGVKPIDDSNNNTPPKSSLELGLESLSWTKQRLEEFDRLIEYRNQFELPISSDQDDLLFKEFANRPGTGKEFNYAEYLQLKAVNSLLNSAIDYTTQTDDLIENYIDSMADSEDSDTALKLYNLKQSWESGRKQAQEKINQKSKSLGNLGSIFLESFAEFGRILQNSAKGAFSGISAYLRIRALIKGGPLAKLSSYYSTENYWQREENQRISGDLGKLADGLGWILSDKLGDLTKSIDITKSENFSNLAIVVSAIAGDIMGWINKNRVSGFAGLIGDFNGISDEIKKIVDIDKLLDGQSGIYPDEDDREFLNSLKIFSLGKLMSAAFSMLLNASKLAGVANDILDTIESFIKIFNDVSVIIEEGYEVMSRGDVRHSYDRHIWLNELYNSTIRIDREYIIGVAEVLGDYVAKQ